jgi:YVTN family beta-propeller protein
MSYDSLNNYVYCACRGSNQVYVIDAHRDSVVTAIAVGAEPFALAWNPFELRTYVANYASSSISVIRDSLHPGITEGGVEALADRHVTPTVVRGVLLLAPPSASNKPQAARLLDVFGREVMELYVGTNDIHRLAPGVYFLREEVSARRSATGVRKIVVTR